MLKQKPDYPERTPIQIAARLGRIHLIDPERAKVGGHVSALTLDVRPNLMIVDPRRPFESKLTEIGEQVLIELHRRYQERGTS